MGVGVELPDSRVRDRAFGYRGVLGFDLAFRLDVTEPEPLVL